VERCSQWLSAEVRLLRPRLVVPVGTLAIESVLGHTGKLLEVVGKKHRATLFGHTADVIPLPHPSGASTWHRMEPGKPLLEKALRLLARHTEVRRTFGPRRGQKRRLAGDVRRKARRRQNGGPAPTEGG
jgi:uracil-DNA glycosylase